MKTENTPWKSLREFFSNPHGLISIGLFIFFLGVVLSGCGVNVDSTPGGLFPSMKQREPTATFTQEVILSGCVRVTKYLNIRSGPGTQYSIIDYLSEGDCVTLLERNHDSTWVRTIDGWISINYLVVVGRLSQLPVASEIQATEIIPESTKASPTQPGSTP